MCRPLAALHPRFPDVLCNAGADAPDYTSEDSVLLRRPAAIDGGARFYATLKINKRNPAARTTSFRVLAH